MQIKFDRVTLHNFLSFVDAEICLDRGGYTLISGINENPADSATSNGAGKSTLFEAVSWALTGETIRGVKDVVNMHTTGGTFVKLEFSVDNVPYVLLRSKEHKEYKTNLKIYINNEDKSGKGIRDSEKLLAEYLPDLTSSLIGSVIILGQGLPNRFSNNTPSGRKEVLEKLSKSDFMIEDLKNRIANRKSTLQEQQRDAENNFNTLLGKESIVEKDIESSTTKLSTMAPIDDIVQQIEATENLLQDITTQMASHTIELEKLRIRESNGKEWYEKCAETYATECEQITQKNQTRVEALSETISGLKAQIKIAETDIRSKDSVTDICPTCGQKLAGVTKIDTTSAKEALAQLKEALRVHENDYSKLNTEIATAKAEKLSKYNNNKEKYRTTMQTITDSIRTHETVMSSFNSQLSSLNRTLTSLTAEKAVYDETRKSLKEKIENLNAEMLKISEKKLYYNNRMDDISKHLTAVSKMQTVVTRDFRGYLLTNVIEYINTKAKNYSEDVFGVSNIEFCLDGNNINIIYDSKQYENLSGGERQKVDIIVQLSIRDMLCKFMNFSSNILCVDECFDNLDAEGCQKILTLLSSKLHDVDSIYIITHHADVSVPCDNEIVISKGADGISYVKRG